MPSETEICEALSLVPLRQDVKWVDLSFLFPGRIVEDVRNPQTGKFGAVDFGDADAAAHIVELHNARLGEPNAQ
jgi:hypothetical protein